MQACCNLPIRSRSRPARVLAGRCSRPRRSSLHRSKLRNNSRTCGTHGTSSAPHRDRRVRNFRGTHAAALQLKVDVEAQSWQTVLVSAASSLIREILPPHHRSCLRGYYCSRMYDFLPVLEHSSNVHVVILGVYRSLTT